MFIIFIFLIWIFIFWYFFFDIWSARRISHAGIGWHDPAQLLGIRPLPGPLRTPAIQVRDGLSRPSACSSLSAERSTMREMRAGTAAPPAKSSPGNVSQGSAAARCAPARAACPGHDGAASPSRSRPTAPASLFAQRLHQPAVRPRMGAQLGAPRLNEALDHAHGFLLRSTPDTARPTQYTGPASCTVRRA